MRESHRGIDSSLPASGTVEDCQASVLLDSL